VREENRPRHRQRLAREGVKVAIASRSRERLDVAATTIPIDGGLLRSV
jgi:hypothetical protein